MYFEIEYGWSTDPDKHVKIIKSSYSQARQTMRNIFRSYKMQLEDGIHLENFTCILKQRGFDHGSNKESTKKQSK